MRRSLLAAWADDLASLLSLADHAWSVAMVCCVDDDRNTSPARWVGPWWEGRVGARRRYRPTPDETAAVGLMVCEQPPSAPLIR